MSSRCKYTTKEVDLLARLIKAEALGEGKKGIWQPVNLPIK